MMPQSFALRTSPLFSPLPTGVLVWLFHRMRPSWVP
jgi:hypothetical protein